MHPWQATILGIVEGLTEFLPVSSTGHLILAARVLQLHGDAAKTFEVVIQAGALAAVLGLYRTHLGAMWEGLLGRNARGRQLLFSLAISFSPAAVAGIFLRKAIKDHLFSTWPVVWALALGGVLMILSERWFAGRQPSTDKTLHTVTFKEALFIGCIQCLALWPGTSRSMVTILAGLTLGWPATMAAEYSFLLAVPVLGAATLLDLVKGGSLLVGQMGWVSILCGYAAAGIVAAIAIKAFIHHLTRNGLAPFGWYRVGLAAVIALIGWLR